MLSSHTIARHVATHRTRALINGLVDNGLDLPLPLQIRLSQQPTAAVALGLQRVLELSYGLTPHAEELVHALVGAQQADGSFEGDPLATAAAAAALGRLLREFGGQLGDGPANAYDRALWALQGFQHNDPDQAGFASRDDRTWEDQALTTAFVVNQLGNDESFRQVIRYADLMNWFEQHDDQMPEDARRLWHGAQSTEVPVDASAELVAA